MATDVSITAQNGKLTRNAARGGVLFISVRLLTQLIQWPITFIVARLLDPSDYGLMTSGMIFVSLTDLLADAGLGRALIQKKDLQRHDVDEGFTVSVGLSVLYYAALFSLAGPAATFLETPRFESFLRVLALTTLLMPFRSVPSSLLAREYRMGTLSAIHIVSGVVQSATVLGMAVAGLGCWSLLIGVLTARLLEAVLQTWYADWQPRLCRPGKAACDLLAFCVHVTLTGLLWYVYSNADFAVVGKMLGQTVLGYYALAFQLMSLPVQKLTDNVNHVVYPIYCRFQGDRPRLRDSYLRLTMMLSAIGTPILMGMALVAEDAFLLLLGAKWVPAIRPFQGLCVAGAVMVVMATFPTLLTALGRPDLSMKGSLASALVLPVGFLVGAWYRGVAGVCLTWILLYPLMLAVFVHLTRRTTGIALTSLCRVQVPVLATVLSMSAVVLAVRSGMGADISVKFRLLVSIAVGVAAYAGFLFVFARHTVIASFADFWRDFRGRSAAPAPAAAA